MDRARNSLQEKPHHQGHDDERINVSYSGPDLLQLRCVLDRGPEYAAPTGLVGEDIVVLVDENAALGERIFYLGNGSRRDLLPRWVVVDSTGFRVALIEDGEVMVDLGQQNPHKPDLFGCILESAEYLHGPVDGCEGLHRTRDETDYLGHGFW